MKPTKSKNNGLHGGSFADWLIERTRGPRQKASEPTVASQTDDTIEIFQARIKQLFSIAKQQAFEIAAERRKRQRAERRLAATRERQQQAERSRHHLKRTLRRASRELNSLRRHGLSPTAIDLNSRIEQINRDYEVNLSEQQAKTARSEAKLEKVEKERDQLLRAKREGAREAEPSISERVASERDRRRVAEKEYKNTKLKLRHASRALNTLRREHSKCGKTSLPTALNGVPNSNAIFEAILPNLELVRGGATRLLSAREVKQVFDDLQRLNDNPHVMRGERVGSAEPWLEIRPTLTDRVYYRNTNGRGRYRVLIGDKNSQSNDINWMRNN